jgi:hypothetical protein
MNKPTYCAKVPCSICACSLLSAANRWGSRNNAPKIPQTIPHDFPTSPLYHLFCSVPYRLFVVERLRPQQAKYSLNFENTPKRDMAGYGQAVHK